MIELRKKLRNSAVRIYKKTITGFYDFNVILAFKQKRYVYRMVSGKSNFFPRGINSSELARYVEGQLIEDFRSGRLSAKGLKIIIRSIEQLKDLKLHGLLSKILYKARFNLPRLKAFDKLNDGLAAELICKVSDSSLREFCTYISKNKDNVWSYSFLYRIISELFARGEWKRVIVLSELYLAAQPPNLQINKKYLISLAKVGCTKFSVYIKSPIFCNQSISDQVEIYNAFLASGNGLDDGEFSGALSFEGWLVCFLVDFDRTAKLSNKISPEIFAAYSCSFIEAYYREKFLFSSRAVSALSSLSGIFLVNSGCLAPIYQHIYDHHGKYGGEGWGLFIDRLHMILGGPGISENFSVNFLESTGYSIKNSLAEDGFISFESGDLVPVDDSICVCISRVSEPFIESLDGHFDFKGVVEYGIVSYDALRAKTNKIFSVNDIMPMPGASLDMQAYHACNEISTSFFSDLVDKAGSGSGSDEWSESFIREVFALAAEDLLYVHMKRAVSLADYLKKTNVRRVVFPYRQSDLSIVSAVAHAMHNLAGVECVFVREYGVFDRARYYVSWKTASHEKINLSRVVEEYSSVRVARSNSDRDSMLMLSSLGDAAYYKSAVEILKASDYSANYIFNLSENIISRSFISERNVVIDDELSGSRSGARVKIDDFEGVEPACLKFGGGFYPYSKIFNHFLEFYLPSRVVRFKNQIDFILHYFDGREVSSVITIPGRSPVSRAVSLIFSRSGVRTVDVQAFFISPMPRYKGSLAESYCAITQDQLELYVDCHQQPGEQRLYRVGSLMMDNQLSAVQGVTLESSRVEYDIDLDKFVVFFAEQHGDGGYSLEIAEGLISSLPSSMYLIVKLHPRSPASAVAHLMSIVRKYQKAGQVLVTQTGHLYKLIVASDVVVTQFSNVGLEAAVLRKKVLSVQLSDESPVLDFGALGIADVVYSIDDMIRYIGGLVGEGASKPARYLLENPELGDGAAGRRVIDISRGRGFYHEGVCTQ